MEKTYEFKNDQEICTKSMSLKDLENCLTISGANSLRDLFSISNIDQNKIASGNIGEDLEKFAGINFNELNQADQTRMKNYFYVPWQREIDRTMANEQGFSSDEVGYVLASIIEEAKPALLACVGNTQMADNFYGKIVSLQNELDIFIVKHSENRSRDGGYGAEVMNDTADDALNLMLEFSKFSDWASRAEPGHELQPGFTKIALYPIFKAAHQVREVGAARGLIAAGGGIALAALIKNSHQASDEHNPQLARCASFEPILAVLNMNGLMRGAAVNYQTHVSNGTINTDEVRGAWASTVSKFFKVPSAQYN